MYISHRDDTKQGGEAPLQPHLGLLTGPGEITAIPVGAHIFAIENPRRADTITEYLLEKVIYKDHVLTEIRLVAYSKSTKTTRRLRLIASYDGEHVSPLDAETQKAEEQFVNPLTGKKG